ncbi:MAG: glycosyltransferase [Actinomycetes bacterium]
MDGWTSQRRTVNAHLRKVQYDLIWCSPAENRWHVPHRPGCPVVVDLDDLEGRKTRLYRASVGGPGGRVRLVARNTFLDENARRWDRYQRRVSRESALSLVSGIDDAGPQPDGVVFTWWPNALPRDDDPSRTRWSHPNPNRLGYVGALPYPPNTDAVRRLVQDILPGLRTIDPNITVWIIGRAAANQQFLHDIPGVVVRSDPPDMAPEIANVDILIAPIRFGGGTRIKILEALADGLPVISTVMGCEGLGLRHGEHLLIADTDEGIINAYREMRAGWTTWVPKMAARGSEFVRERYAETHVSRQLHNLVSPLLL